LPSKLSPPYTKILRLVVTRRRRSSARPPPIGLLIAFFALMVLILVSRVYLIALTTQSPCSSSAQVGPLQNAAGACSPVSEVPRLLALAQLVCNKTQWLQAQWRKPKESKISSVRHCKPTACPLRILVPRLSMIRVDGSLGALRSAC